MEEAEVREQQISRTWWLGAVMLALALLASAMNAQAQSPGTLTDENLPVPFQNPGPSSPPSNPKSGPKLMDPFPVVRTAGAYTLTKTRFTRFTVKGPVGTKLAASCKRSKCRIRRTLKTRKTIHLRPLERSFKSGTRIRLRLTAPGVIGKYVEIRTRRGKRPLRSDACLRPGRSKPVRCEG
jgi:hypothetical protein